MKSNTATIIWSQKTYLSFAVAVINFGTANDQYGIVLDYFECSLFNFVIMWT